MEECSRHSPYRVIPHPNLVGKFRGSFGVCFAVNIELEVCTVNDLRVGR